MSSQSTKRIRNPRYWAMFMYGGVETICSQHTSECAAIRASQRCEKRGGAKHWIIQVIRVGA